jgi:hypothetical protein
MQTAYPPIRRVVTGHNAAHVAKVLLDEPAINAKYPQPGLVSTMLLCTDSTPAAIPMGEQPEDMDARIIGTAPPRNGTHFAVIDFPPDCQPHMHRTKPSTMSSSSRAKSKWTWISRRSSSRPVTWSSAARTLPGRTAAANVPALALC